MAIRNTNWESFWKIRETTQQMQEGAQMPYEQDVFFCLVDTNARNAYVHLAKIFLYGNSTNDANQWINEIVYKFTIPSLLGKVRVNNQARTKLLVRGYIENFFDKNFEDYELYMENFCAIAINEVEEKASKKQQPIPVHDDIKQSMERGKSILIAYANAVASLSNGTTQEEADRTLQKVLRKKLNAAFDLDI